jgi:hypothetical protein
VQEATDPFGVTAEATMQQRVTNPQKTGYSPGVAWADTPIVSTPTAKSGLLPPGPACQPCPDCGGLECLCRPRFFAGQLLTDQDLNRLEQYIVAKNQLHNRYLVGRGVVCGLDVVCSPCANTVSVSSGYAIDTCGNDIIVCSPDTVDICKLIKACTPAQVDCGPYKNAADCRDLEQEWILAIRYQEVPSRGITPLTGASQCSCGAGAGGCSCGAAVAKACGCGSMLPAASCCGDTMLQTTPVSTNLPRRGAPPACEPTVTCESYRYEVFLAPPAPSGLRSPVRGIGGLAGTIGGEMFEQIACCVQGLFANMPALPSTLDVRDPASRTSWANYCCSLRQALIQYVIAHGSGDCLAIARLHAVSCPDPKSEEGFASALWIAYVEELLIFIELLIGCVCTAALPPCPPPGDPRVPLASVRVRASDCTLISVCDWTPLRKNVVTVKTLGYWLGWLPFVPMLRTFMQDLCCAVLHLPSQFRQYQFTRDAAQAHAAASDTKATAMPQDLNTPVSFGTQSYQSSNPISEAIAANLAGSTNQITVDDLAHALFDPVDPATPADRLAAMPHAKVLAEIARPLVASLGPLFGAATGNALQQNQQKLSDTDAKMTSMRTELDELKITLRTQQAALDALRAPPTPPAGSGSGSPPTPPAPSKP